MLVTAAVFWPTLKHEFLLYDDQQYVTENVHVQAGLSANGVRWAFRSMYASNWHPLTWVSHMLDWQLYGMKPAGHHLTSVLLHTANTVLLFGVLNRLTRKKCASAFVAALFAWHPLHVESVAWIAERKDVLSAFFGMLTLYTYARYAECKAQSTKQKTGTPARSRSSMFYGLALVCFICGLMSKPMVVTLPCVLLLLDFWPLERLRWPIRNKQLFGPVLLEKVPFFVLSALACVLTIIAQKHAYSMVSAGSLPLQQRLVHAVLAYAHYLSATFLPRQLAVYYPYETSVAWWMVALAAALLALITLLALLVIHRSPYLWVGWFWYLGTLVPVIGIVQVGDQAWADRYTYLPLIGIFLAVVWGADDFLRRLNQNFPRIVTVVKLLEPVIGIAVCIAFLVATTLQLRFWMNTRTLFEHAAQVTRNNGRALALLGSLLAAEGKVDEAIPLYRRALSYRPHDPEAHFFLGKAFEQKGKLKDATQEFEAALWFKPLQEKTRLALGSVLAKQTNYDAAINQFQAALKINPESAVAENNLARLLHTQGRLDEAIGHYAAALKLDPRLAQAHNNLGVLLLQKGDPVRGAEELKKALQLRPDDLETEYNLGLALNDQRNWNAGQEIFAPLAARQPNNPQVHYQLGLALAHQNKTPEAMSEYARALLLRPEYPEALDRLSWILATDSHPEFRNGEEALRMATSACELTQNKQPRMLMTLAMAYAEVGRFSEALEKLETTRQLALDAGESEIVAKCEMLTEAVRAQKPWREPRN